MACEKKSGLALAAALLFTAFGVGCKGGGGSTTAYRADAFPVAVSYSDLYSAGQALPTAPVSTQSPQASSIASSAASEFCPITGAQLGSMGEPVPVIIDGRTVYVCCRGCVEKLQQHPRKYLRPAAANSSGYLEGRAAKSSAPYSPSDASGSSCSSGEGGCKSGCP